MDENKSMRVTLPFARIESIGGQNSEFTRVKIWAFASGANRNYSYVSKDELNKAMSSLDYLPVVGHLIEDTDEDGNVTYKLGGHDYIVTDDLEVKMITVPYGVVIDGTAKWETVEEYGETVEYITVEAYLWTSRWPELKEAIASDEVWFNESAELTYENYRPWTENPIFTELLGVNFSALCLLNRSEKPEENVEPCFISARVEPLSNFSLQSSVFSQMMGEMKDQLTQLFEYKEHQKGGKVLGQQEKKEIFEKFGLDMDSVDFEINEDMSAEELTEALEAYVASNEQTPDENFDADQNTDSGEQTDDGEGQESGEQQVQFSLMNQEKRKKICDSISNMNSWKENEDGSWDEVYCYVNDFDDEFVYFTKCHYTNEGCDEKNMKIAYSIVEDEVQLAGDAVEVFVKWLTADEVAKIEEDKKEFDALVEFKRNAERAAYDARVSELLDQFNDVSSEEGFSAIKNEMEGECMCDLELCEIKLFALRGKKAHVEKNQKNFSLRVGLSAEESDDDDGYGGLVSRAHKRRNLK